MFALRSADIPAVMKLDGPGRALPQAVLRQLYENLPALTSAPAPSMPARRSAAVVLYAYRHSYAQRHADAGTPPDVLRELMGHKALGTTQTCYRVTEHRVRGAVDKIVQFQFDRHGARIWKDAKALLDHEHARMRVGAVAVPFGTCTEPSNVSAGGHACPFRFRCLGCRHFRTDPSYLPELRDYLQTLLRNRERILAAAALDDWAATEATRTLAMNRARFRLRQWAITAASAAAAERSFRE